MVRSCRAHHCAAMRKDGGGFAKNRLRLRVRPPRPAIHTHLLPLAIAHTPLRLRHSAVPAMPGAQPHLPSATWFSLAVTGCPTPSRSTNASDMQACGATGTTLSATRRASHVPKAVARDPLTRCHRQGIAHAASLVARALSTIAKRPRVCPRHCKCRPRSGEAPTPATSRFVHGAHNAPSPRPTTAVAR
jgi:hypothetical protein